MNEWAKSRLIGLVACSLAAFVGLTVVLTGVELELPAVIGGGITSLRWVAFLAIIPAITLAQAMEPRKRLQELAPPRRLAPWDGGLTIAVVLVLLATLSIANLTLSPIPGVAFRNAVLLPVLTLLLATRVSAPAASGLMTALVVITQSYAPSAPHSTWIRIFQPEGSPLLGFALTLVSALTLGHFIASSDRGRISLAA